jgi:rhamnopyranosyl-N-acetylglucosaminyl-diphospho-decaprenol beta-1,3/1,4-galactofuranosyltransferase
VRVAAVVVTYNRSALLLECLAALDRQSRPVDRVILVDNGDAETTRSVLATAAAPIVKRLTYIALSPNAGGAGGFQVGIERAYRDGYDWLWLMDDDVVPETTALSELLEALGRAPEAGKPVLLASRVVWTDGKSLPANDPKPKWQWTRRKQGGMDAGISPIRSSTFVSVLIDRQAVARHGYPIPDYFLMVDDIEYTARILKAELGLLVRRSVVCHKVSPELARLAGPPQRFYFLARNYLWMLLYSRAFTWLEKPLRWFVYLGLLGRYVASQYFRRDAVVWTAKGVLAALARRPQSTLSAAPTESPSRIESAIP